MGYWEVVTSVENRAWLEEASHGESAHRLKSLKSVLRRFSWVWLWIWIVSLMRPGIIWETGLWACLSGTKQEDLPTVGWDPGRRKGVAVLWDDKSSLSVFWQWMECDSCFKPHLLWQTSNCESGTLLPLSHTRQGIHSTKTSGLIIAVTRHDYLAAPWTGLHPLSNSTTISPKIPLPISSD